MARGPNEVQGEVRSATTTFSEFLFSKFFDGVVEEVKEVMTWEGSEVVSGLDGGLVVETDGRVGEVSREGKKEVSTE